MPDYDLEGPKWGAVGLGSSGGTVSWAVDRTVPSNFIEVLTAAFADWSTYADIQFRQITSLNVADIVFSVGAIDGLDGVLGETRYSYSGALFESASVEFDNGERWQASGSHIVSADGVKLFNVALHEIGHAIGLDHYDAAPAIMNAFVSPAVKDLTPSDLGGIGALYGRAPLASANGLTVLGSHPGWTVAAVGDFNGDGTSDIIWRNALTQQVDQWQMKDGHWLRSVDLGNSKGADWQLAGTGDFNHDAQEDVLWFNTKSSHVDLWQMNNGQWSRSIDVGAHPGSYSVASVGDFNADGTTDVLWRDSSNGSVDEWQIKNGQWSKSVDLGSSKGSDWKLAGIGDFNADGSQDVLWFNTNSGQVDEWLIKNGQWSKSVDLGSGHNPIEWQVAGIGDFNGDGTSDIKWFNKSTGQVDVWHMLGGSLKDSVDAGTQNPSLASVGIGDFNHDGISDPLLLNVSSGGLFGQFFLT